MAGLPVIHRDGQRETFDAVVVGSASIQSRTGAGRGLMTERGIVVNAQGANSRSVHLAAGDVAQITTMGCGIQPGLPRIRRRRRKRCGQP